MKPYFYTHHVPGLLLLIVVAGWAAMELAQRRQRRGEAILVSGIGRRMAFRGCLITSAVVLFFAPRIVPAGGIRPGPAAFAAGMVVLLAGVGLRGWSFRTLGEYFTFNVMVSADQPVITAGPYRLLRHPSYTAVLLACIEIGLTSANWVGLVAVTLLVLVAILRRIRVEENALITTLGDRYRGYAAERKRLVPFIWLSGELDVHDQARLARADKGGRQDTSR